MLMLGLLRPSLPFLLLLLLLLAASGPGSGSGRHRHHHQHVHGAHRLQAAGQTQPQAQTQELQHPGRRVCSRREAVQRPEKVKESYCRSRMQQYTQRCGAGAQLCRGVRMVCEPAYREVVRMRASQRTVHSCCPGWAASRTTPPYGCDAPVCHPPCENGGTCVAPGTCQCPAGTCGQRCQTVKEARDFPAEHKHFFRCIDSTSKARCECKPGFEPSPDGQSCRPQGKPLGIAPDPTDGDFEFLARKLAKLEKLLLVRQRHELEEEAEESEVEFTTAAATADAIAKLSGRIDTVQIEIQRLLETDNRRCAQIQDRLHQLESTCSRITQVERTVHHIMGNCRIPANPNMWP